VVRAVRCPPERAAWGLIGGSVVAAVAAVFLCTRSSSRTAGQDWASAAYLAHPLGDLLPMGFAVVM
jgi:hypothetical protein